MIAVQKGAMRILSPYIQMVPKPAGTAAHIPPERDERQGLNHAARPDRPIAFSGKDSVHLLRPGQQTRDWGKDHACYANSICVSDRKHRWSCFSGGTTFSDSPVAGLSINLPSCKTGAVAGAIPRVLLWVPFQRAAQMGTTLGGRGQEVDHGLKAIDHQLGAEDRSGGGNTSA